MEIRNVLNFKGKYKGTETRRVFQNKVRRNTLNETENENQY
jgi:hypothetical protein